MTHRILGLLALAFFLIPAASAQDLFPTPGQPGDECRYCPTPLENETDDNITAIGCEVIRQADEEYIAGFIFWLGENFGPNIPRDDNPPEGEDPPKDDPPGGEPSPGESPTADDEEPPFSPTDTGDGGDTGTDSEASSTCQVRGQNSALVFRDLLDSAREGRRFAPRGRSMPRGTNVRLLTKRERNQSDRSEFIATFMVQTRDGASVPVLVQGLGGKLIVRTHSDFVILQGD